MSRGYLKNSTFVNDDSLPPGFLDCRIVGWSSLHMYTHRFCVEYLKYGMKYVELVDSAVRTGVKNDLLFAVQGTVGRNNFGS